MNIQLLKDQLPGFAKDIKLNLGTVLTIEGAPDLTQNQIFGIALAAAHSIGHPLLLEAMTEESKEVLTDAEKEAAKAAASIMAMNNIYYRFTYMASDKEYTKMPARLRMNVISNPGIPKVDFELYSLGVSIINGCGLCVDAHIKEAEHGGVSKLGIQSVARIVAVLNAVATSLSI